MTGTTGPRVDACVDALPGWRQAFCREVRQLVHAGSQVTETIKRTNRPCFVLEGCVPLRRATRWSTSPARPCASHRCRRC